VYGGEFRWWDGVEGGEWGVVGHWGGKTVGRVVIE